MKLQNPFRTTLPLLLAALFLSFAALTEAVMASGGNDNFEIHGAIRSLPASGLIGDWNVAGRTVRVTSSTIIKQESGTVKVGAIVEVKGQPQSDGSFIAAKIELRQSSGGGGYFKLHGAISSLPSTPDKTGDWIISGRTVRVTAMTKIELEGGPAITGAFVEIKGWLQTDGSINAYKIETKSGAGVEDFTFFGAIGSLPGTAGQIGAWVVAGRTVQVTSSTRIEQERRPVAVGVYVKVEGFPNPDGSIRATEIKTLTATSVSAASFRETALSADSISSVFGLALSSGTEIATTLPLPSSLSGTEVKIRDSAGIERAAQLFFASPGQVNFLIPSGAAPGAATITVTSEDGDIITGALQIAFTAPSLFTANSTGQGVPSALVLRVKPDGSQSYESVAQWDDSQKQFIPRPLDFGSDDLYLVLFGTGIRFRSGMSGVTARAGGGEVEVQFAGAQGNFAGLDQVNLKLPRHLSGRGEIELTLTVDGQEANPVRIHLR